MNRCWYAITIALMALGLAYSGMAFYIATGNDLDIPGAVKQEARDDCEGAAEFDSCYKTRLSAIYPAVQH